MITADCIEKDKPVSLVCDVLDERAMKKLNNKRKKVLKDATKAGKMAINAVATMRKVKKNLAEVGVSAEKFEKLGNGIRKAARSTYKYSRKMKNFLTKTPWGTILKVADVAQSCYCGSLEASDGTWPGRSISR